MPGRNQAHDHSRPDIGDTLFFATEAETVAGGIRVLDQCDQSSHLRIALMEQLAGPESDALVLELVVHYAVVELRDRVKAHLERLTSGDLPSPHDEFTITRGELLDLVSWHDYEPREKIADAVLLRAVRS